VDKGAFLGEGGGVPAWNQFPEVTIPGREVQLFTFLSIGKLRLSSHGGLDLKRNRGYMMGGGGENKGGVRREGRRGEGRVSLKTTLRSKDLNQTKGRK